ncbi:MAG: MFS transporter [archaeon]|nr:MFS transporter [archaeon]
MAIENKKDVEIIGTKQKFAYSFGSIPAAMYYGIFMLIHVDFFYDHLQIPEHLFITGMVIYAVINAFNDPLLGQLSDKTDRKKWGSRRIIYIKYGSPIWALTFILTWFPWTTDNTTPIGQLLMFLHFVISICTFDTMLSLVIMCWMALLPEMTSNIDERNKIGFITGIYGLISIVPILLAQLILDATTDDYSTLQIYNIMIAVICVICYIIVVKYSKERPEFEKDVPPPLKESIIQTLKSKSYMLYIGYSFCAILNGSIVLPFIFAYTLILGEGDFTSLLGFFAIYVFVGYTSNIICLKLKPKYGMHKLVITYGILKIIGGVVIFFLAVNNAPQPVIWVGLIWTTFFGGATVFNGTLMSLPMDEDEVKHGSRREGMFLGTNALFTKPANSLGPIIGVSILTTFSYNQMGGFNDQPETAFVGIKILFFLIPQIISAIGLIFLYFYPIHGERLKKLEEDLKNLHEKKKEEINLNV